MYSAGSKAAHEPSCNSAIRESTTEACNIVGAAQMCDSGLCNWITVDCLPPALYDSNVKAYLVSSRAHHLRSGYHKIPPRWPWSTAVWRAAHRWDPGPPEQPCAAYRGTTLHRPTPRDMSKGSEDLPICNSLHQMHPWNISKLSPAPGHEQVLHGTEIGTECGLELRVPCDLNEWNEYISEVAGLPIP